MDHINNQEPNISDYIDSMRSYTYTNVGLAERVIKTQRQLSQPEIFVNRFLGGPTGWGVNHDNKFLGLYKYESVQNKFNLCEISALLRRCDVESKFITRMLIKDQYQVNFEYMKLCPDAWVITSTHVRTLGQNFFLQETA